ncbi:MAG: Rv1355c family protein [Flavobacteriales bacterium]
MGGTTVREMAFRAELLRLTIPAHGLRFRELLDTLPPERVLDTIQVQLEEYAKLRNPSRKLSEAEIQAEVVSILGGEDPETYGTWVHYPWSDRLVHTLPEAEFAFVRTNRNRNKITAEEQEKLSRLKVGVIGLSVGQSVSLAMALERSFGEIRLADFDTLDLSNLNRLRSGIHNLGLNKALMTAREIAELDPYLNVVCYTDGLTKENMDAFFTEGGQLDVLVEECDSVEIKILARQKAKTLGIPVVMDMSDRGCLDIERFDLEPERPLMHGWIDHLDLEAASRPMSAEEKVPYMLPITGVDTLSPRMKASVIELGQTVSTWPQLATSVVLGGALAGDAVRRIALGHLQSSGRWYIDLDELVADKATTSSIGLQKMPAAFDLSQRLLEEIQNWLGQAPADAIALDKLALEALLKAGGLAPSAGNVQPWKFLWEKERLVLLHDTTRSFSQLDPDHRIAYIALGACMENIALKGKELGFQVAIEMDGAPAPCIASFCFRELPSGGQDQTEWDGLAAQIPTRCTDRKISRSGPLAQESRQRILAASNSMPGVQGKLYTEPADLAEIGAIYGAAERIRVLNGTAHEQYFSREIRWDIGSVQATKDGLDIATLTNGPMDLAVLRVAADPRTRELLASWGGGRNLELAAEAAVRNSAAVLLVSITAGDIQAVLSGGRVVERTWLAATECGLAVQPICSPIFLSHLLPHRLPELSVSEEAELKGLRSRMNRLFGTGANASMLFLMRLSIAEANVVRSLRLDIEDVLAKRNIHPN